MKKIILILLISLNIGSVVAQTPLGEEFTYQGELKDANGNPHNGVFDFKFIAYDAQLDGTGTNLGQFVAEDITVTNGIFTTQIDYSILGDQPFVGNKVWLEISVRIGTTTGGYQQLLPRQQVTATPYANYATIAEMVATNAVGSQEIQNNSITAADIGANAVGTSEIDSSQVQRRVASACPAGEFMQSVNQDGSVVCVAGATGGLTTVTSTDIVDGTIQAVDIDNSQIQQRITSVCSGGRVVKSVNASGVATCIFPTPSENSVNSAKVTDGSIVAVDVDTSQIQQRITGSCIFPEYVTGVAQDGSVVCSRMPLPTANNILNSPVLVANTSIAIGLDGNPMISYTGYDPITNHYALNIVQCSNPYCTVFNSPKLLDSSSADIGRFSSLAIGKTDGLPVVSYYDGTNRNLKVVKCGTTDCTITDPNLPNHNIITVLDGDTPAIDVGAFTSIVLDSNDLPVISYYDYTNGDLKVIKCSDTDCSESIGANTIRTLDSGVDNVGEFTSIALDAGDIPIISYYDSTNGDLKVVKCVILPNCSFGALPIVLDGSGGDDVGIFTNITIPKSGDNLPIISYYDNTNGALKVLKCSVPDCSIIDPLVTNANIITVLDGNIGIDPILLGINSSIAFGQDNNPIISYFDDTNDDLKVVKCQTQNCEIFYPPITLDSNGLVGRYSSIAIGDDGNPIISYIGLGLKVFSCGDARCSRGL